MAASPHAASNADVSTVVFDIGGVLVDWNPDHLYRKVIDDPDERRWFIENVVSNDWNHTMDAGRSVDDAIAELMATYPEHADLIDIWRARWPEMLGGEIPGTRALAEQLSESEVHVYALTNWSAETWPHGVGRFPFLGEIFEGVVVSGQEGVAKPDPAIFEILIGRFGLDPTQCAYIDDMPYNVEAATRLGFHAHRFVGADELETWLTGLGLDVS